MRHRLMLWLIRAWPIFSMGLLVGTHLAVLARYDSHSLIINKVTGTLMQILGGLIVLHSVNDNLGLFRSHSLTSVIAEWFRSFPLLRKTTTVSTSIAITGGSATVHGQATIVKAAQTIEERVAIIEQAINELRAGMNKQKGELIAALEKAKTELMHSISTNQSAIVSLTSKIEKATVGGFKQQTFGVLLAIYGAFINVFA